MSQTSNSGRPGTSRVQQGKKTVTFITRFTAVIGTVATGFGALFIGQTTIASGATTSVQTPDAPTTTSVPTTDNPSYFSSTDETSTTVAEAPEATTPTTVAATTRTTTRATTTTTAARLRTTTTAPAVSSGGGINATSGGS